MVLMVLQERASSAVGAVWTAGLVGCRAESRAEGAEERGWVRRVALYPIAVQNSSNNSKALVRSITVTVM
ncbi:hypothetical protein GCM10027346_13580 [Hymenobacter seoulensis]